MSKKQLQSIRGMNDLLPAESPLWQYLESKLRALLAGYAYSEVRFPIVESTELFKRSIGEVTDIVEKEMYTFDDRNGDSLTLRPEGTAGCVRLANQHGLVANQAVQRLWYTGPMFRHERPQKGRLRQFHQFGVEAFGMDGPDIDAEQIIMTARLWKQLGVIDDVELQINSIGTAEERATYRDALSSFLQQHIDRLDEDSKRRLTSNPLRILDSKNAETQEILIDAPDLVDYLGEESKGHFNELCKRLESAGVAYTVNSKLVRGLDYYGLTVFEWVTDKLGAQGTVCAGGRYNGLVEQLGGKPTAAVGFAMGIERLTLLLEATGQLPELGGIADIYIISSGERAALEAASLAEAIRESVPSLKVLNHCGGGSFKRKFKKADKSGAATALIIGEDEVNAGLVNIKPLREAGMEQISLPRSEVIDYLSKAR